MIKYIIGKVLGVLGTKPFRLWGMSLLSGLITMLAGILCGAVPIAALAVGMVLSLGMAMIFLAGYRGQDFNSDELFIGFKDFARVAGGMLWMSLWLFIWALVPVMGVVKVYSYRFTPYILAQNKNITATEALRESMRMTNGCKGKMFGTDLLIMVAPAAINLVLLLLSLIPYVGVVFRIIMVIFAILFAIAAPLIFGLVQAAFYDEISAGVDPAKYSSYSAQKGMERQIKAQMKAEMQAQMEQLRQQQKAEMQAKMQQPPKDNKPDQDK